MASSPPPTTDGGQRVPDGEWSPLFQYFATEDPSIRGEQYWHFGCPDPLGQGYEGLVWSDGAGTFTCQNCGTIATSVPV
jgi:hypothetical protein